MKYDLSIIVPSILPENWMKLYTSLKKSVKPYSFEVIFVGPYAPLEEILHPNAMPNTRFVQDYGCPSRAFCIGASLAEGEYIAFGTDDAIAQPNAFREVLDIVKSGIADVCITRYTEGINVYGPDHAKHFDHPSWKAGYHDGLRLPNVNPNWFIGLPLLSKHLYIEFGGLDCTYQHINLNIYKMLFYMQNAKYQTPLKFTTSPSFVYHVDFDPTRKQDEHPILKAGKEDHELFVKNMNDKHYYVRKEWNDVENKWSKRWSN